MIKAKETLLAIRLADLTGRMDSVRDIQLRVQFLKEPVRKDAIRFLDLLNEDYPYWGPEWGIHDLVRAQPRLTGWARRKADEILDSVDLELWD